MNFIDFDYLFFGIYIIENGYITHIMDSQFIRHLQTKCVLLNSFIKLTIAQFLRTMQKLNYEKLTDSIREKIGNYFRFTMNII